MNTVNEKDLARIRKSDLFDPEWYLNNYPDVKKLGMDPALHFLKYGGLLLRDPGPSFNTRFYHGICPHPFKKNINPLLYSISRKNSNVNYKAILWSAFHMANGNGDYLMAEELAKKYLPEDLKYTVDALRVNLYQKNGDKKNWLASINSYFSNFNMAPISLASCDNIIGSFITDKLSDIKNGPLISVIMPAWNASKTIKYAVGSILKQTWINLELIVVDDCSSDDTWEILKSLKIKDNRLKILRNKVNVGPYVSKNLGLTIASGQYITGHDADDWAHPQRLEKHMKNIKNAGYPRASVEHMIRLTSDGYFSNLDKISNFSFDGVARRASISCMIEASFMRDRLGFWDSVRFGADSEMIARIEHILGDEFKVFNTIGMICLDDESSLTNHPIHGIRANNGRLSDARSSYRDSWREWHSSKMSKDNAFLEFPLKDRRYQAIDSMVVPYNTQLINI
ncbi:glycosyltransferase family 2 protein [Vibrio metschnikovii]|uniref:glycosyltransferase family 2 protein n=1 Tax=Vibrio metschnikovii TaxID=28172 RepID=UPI0013028F05|nr:glycosyltransferase family 2 protein [Vibrio metschnikovii]EKO3621460.1 glycosyltransferase family 2 protein [Vibrio metschnikovii]EKO3625592.1 glycosyltransferase family 2 protein [Vibrio metschnikovii]